MRIKMSDITKGSSTNYVCPQCGTVWTPEEARGLGGNCGQCGTKLKTEYEMDLTSARQLSVRQKKLIDTIMEQHKGVWGQRDLTNAELQKLEQMNDYETLYQDIERYISDQVAKGKNEKWQ